MNRGEPATGDRLRYTRVAIWLHWTIAALVLYNIVGAIAASKLPEHVGGVFMAGHKANGIVILFLSLARLGWRLGHRPPPLPAMPRWQVGAAHGLHWLFYILIIAMPVSGWLFSSAGEKRWSLTFYGLFDLPYLPVPRGPLWSGPPHQFHVVTGYIMAALVLVHIAAALKHHFVDQDRTLARIAPVFEHR